MSTLSTIITKLKETFVWALAYPMHTKCFESQNKTLILIDFFPRSVLPCKSLMGMCRWMGLHFHNWIDYNGVTFLVELLEWGRTFLGFLEWENLGKQGF